MHLRVTLFGAVSLLLIIFMVACQPAGTSTPVGGITPVGVTTTPQEMPTSTMAATEESGTATPEMTATLEMTSTPEMIVTPEMTATETMTSTPTLTGTITATLSSGVMVTQGESVFAANCSICHGAQGQGGSNYPALAGNVDIAATDTLSITHFVLYGQNGQHNFGDKLSDLQIAAVLTYIRSAWGNTAAPVSEQDVQMARQNPPTTATP